jgi:PAS domain S-box-containing protein
MLHVARRVAGSGLLSGSVPTEDELIALLESDERSMSVVITNPRQRDNPMIYVSEEFERQTGYPPEEALGRNCRFLQGPETDPKAVEAIRAALAARTTFTIDLVNYRKSGEAFMNRLRIRPLLDESGELLYFAGAQNPV